MGKPSPGTQVLYDLEENTEAASDDGEWVVPLQCHVGNSLGTQGRGSNSVQGYLGKIQRGQF